MPGKQRSCDCETCRVCKQREYTRRYKERNAEKVRERARQKYASDPEKAKERQRRYLENNPGRANEASVRWRENNPERSREVRKAYYERNAERIRAERLAYRDREPEKERARWTLNNAVRRGDIQKGECEVGADCLGRIEAHHDDYSKPLEVRWLCQRHHMREELSSSQS